MVYIRGFQQLYAVSILSLLSLQCFACFHFPEESNHTALEKRYFRIPQGMGGSAQSSWWPNNQIIYCFEDQNSQTVLEQYLIDGWKLWVDAGIYQTALQFGASTTTICPAGDVDMLHVGTNDEDKIYVTPPGLNLRGPATKMSMSPAFLSTYETNRAATAVAHEIGHAWGLIHEHQRPSLWTSQFGGTGSTNVFDFNCQNLADYQNILTFTPPGLPVGSQNIDKICHYYGVATQYGSAAAQFLPIREPQFYAPFQEGGPSPADWGSIMIYASTTGGIINGGAQSAVITRVDGVSMPSTFFPTVYDVENLASMYPRVVNEIQNSPCLACMQCSPLRSIFSSCFCGDSS